MYVCKHTAHSPLATRKSERLWKALELEGFYEGVCRLQAVVELSGRAGDHGDSLAQAVLRTPHPISVDSHPSPVLGSQLDMYGTFPSTVLP